MSQRPQRAAKRSYADENSEFGEAPDALDDDSPRAAAANAGKRPRREGAGRKGTAARRGTKGSDDEAERGGDSASGGSEDDADHAISGSDDDQPRGRRGGATAARGPRGGARGGSRSGRGSAGAGRGRGGRGGRGGDASAAAGAAAAASGDSDIIMISSDTDDGVEGGAGHQPAAAATAGGRAGRGGRAGGAARGRGRGRGRGASQAPPAGPNDAAGGDASDDGAEGDGGQAGGSGGGGTQARARQDAAAARFAAATGPMQIDPTELAAMRRKIRLYKEEYLAAADKCDVWNDVTNADKNELARCVVRHMMFAARAKPGMPVPRTKLTDAVKKTLGNHRHHRKLGPVWLPWARHMAISTLGLDIEEVAPRLESNVGADAGGAAGPSAGASGSNANGAAAAAAPPASAPATAPAYVLRSALPTALRLQVVGTGGGPGEGSDEWGLTVTLLGLIRLNSNKMEEGQLKRMLDQLGFSEGGQHPLGSIDTHLKRMLDQRYLTADKGNTQADGRQERLFLWGDAAVSEVGPKAVDQWLEKWFQLKESSAAEADDEDGAAGAAGGQ
ncbi:hypothetical protein HXX76_008941 [Chlamydomonas incerta]|uniref:MAGE domain-containing protein n=1 Tax=Chlamydomonas incerta TaxID=51695 RepID=A0A835SVJ2_CHLIN|nr:hypothetical protein HXX76_008941 [Chlamydomonas incerta]|eukprot:KAG2432601.1 hypothetical protein HXX76_008941 [Chlamydomonas incerta]